MRDCVGYHSKGHGFFLEDGSEVYNVLDRNLAVQACGAKPLPQQALPFDHNAGAGFWWANSLNTFTRNVACECDEYGFRFEVVKTKGFDPVLPVLQPDGSRRRVDIRTLPFVRFEDNEAHCQRRHAFNLGGFAGRRQATSTSAASAPTSATRSSFATCAPGTCTGPSTRWPRACSSMATTSGTATTRSGASTTTATPTVG